MQWSTKQCHMKKGLNLKSCCQSFTNELSEVHRDDTVTCVHCSTLSSVLRPAHSFPSSMSVQFIKVPLTESGPGSVVSIATGCGLDGPGIESRWGWDFLHLSRPVLRPTQPPVQWVPGLSRGGKERPGRGTAPHPLL